MASHGGILPVGGTFFVFADYMRPPIRLSSLSKVKVCFVFTHDSVGVGEDGPTHQPIEQLASLRAIPGLHVVRPADANETAQAWRDDGSAVAAGACVVREPSGSLDLVIVATGSEVAVCVHAAESLAERGVGARVVSMPSWDRFEQQDLATRVSIFPSGVPVLAVEAGVTLGWHRYADDVIGIERFGVSAPGNVVLEKLGINAGHVVERAVALLDTERK
jgi:transketolase